MFRDSRKFNSWQTRALSNLSFVLISIIAIGCTQKSGTHLGSVEPVTETKPTSDDGSTAESTKEPVQNQLATNTSALTESKGKPVRLFLEERKGSDPTGQTPLTDDQLHKNFTLMLLASEPDIRARQLMRFLRHVLTEEQKSEALNLALSEDEKFVKLIRRRAEVLENAFDGQNVDDALRKINVETVEISRRFQKRILNEVLTQTQRDDMAAQKKLKHEASKTADSVAAPLATEASDESTEKTP